MISKCSTKSATKSKYKELDKNNSYRTAAH